MEHSLIQIYDARVHDGTLHADAAQRALLPILEEVRRGVQTALASRKKSLFGRFSKQAAPPVKGLYLWGGVGRGKSMLMDLFVDHLPTPARRVHFHAFMQEAHAALHRARADNVADALAPFAAQIAKDIRLLALDEMQITDITDAMVVGRLFQLLMDAGVVVVTTSNRHPDDLYKNGLNRALFLPFIELLKDRLVIHHMHSPTDYRQGFTAGGPVYFTPADAGARAQMDAIWDGLAGGPGAALDIPLQGRSLQIDQYRNGVARCSFYDLCARPLGPADYLALADKIKVLMLDDIPQLSRSNFNEAKRFVTLIDTLYEAKTRLICSAAAAPEMLYVEGTGMFEFERTASRLREMQAADWGA